MKFMLVNSACCRRRQAEPTPRSRSPGYPREGARALCAEQSFPQLGKAITCQLPSKWQQGKRAETQRAFRSVGLRSFTLHFSKFLLGGACRLQRCWKPAIDTRVDNDLSDFLDRHAVVDGPEKMNFEFLELA